jgi:hypothetical protein
VGCEIHSVQQITNAVGESCRSLRTFTLRSFAFVEAIPLNTSGILKALFTCTQLVKVEFIDGNECENICLSIGDADMVELAAAWPNLEVLRLSFSGEDERASTFDLTPRLTLRAIATLVSRCPNLQHLALTVDATSCPWDIDLSQLSLVKSLQTIDFAGSYISDSVQVAKWMGELCPADGVTSAIYSKSIWRSKRSEMWGTVKKYLGWFQANLSEERTTVRVENQSLRSLNRKLEVEVAALREEIASLKRQ